MRESEKLLVQQLRNKDKGAFEHVFKTYYGALCSYANRYILEYESAEEVVQDVFVKFWEKCHTLAPDSSIKSYLYRSVHNSSLNHLKHLKVKDAYRQYVITKMEEESYHFNDYTEEPDLERKIHEAIEELPPRCGTIFKMSRFDGLKYQEIADHLGISVKTVEVQMGKALKVLREKLKAYLKPA